MWEGKQVWNDHIYDKVTLFDSPYLILSVQFSHRTVKLTDIINTTVGLNVILIKTIYVIV